DQRHESVASGKPHYSRGFSFQGGFFLDARMMRRLTFSWLVVSLLFLVSIATDAQTPTPALSAGAAETAKPFDPAVATRAWLDSVPREKREKSDAYFEGGYWLILWNFLLAAAISIFLLASRISARMRDFAERRTRFRAIQVSLYAIPYFVL